MARPGTAVNAGLMSPDIYALAVSGADIYAGVVGGVYISTNNGTTWTAANFGIETTM